LTSAQVAEEPRGDRISYQPGRAYHTIHGDRLRTSCVGDRGILSYLFPDLGESSYDNRDFKQADVLMALLNQRMLAVPDETQHIWKLDGPLEDAPNDEDKTDSIYIIEDLMSGKRITAHIHNLRPFIYDPIRTNPLAVAQQNEQVLIVESILGHRRNRNRRSTLQWSGFDESSDSWEPYKALMHVDKLHDNLHANAMKTLIPREHK